MAAAQRFCSKCKKTMADTNFYQYKNGENQFGLKKSAALEAYNTIIKNYNSVIKQLLDILPEGVEADELESFLGGRK